MCGMRTGKHTLLNLIITGLCRYLAVISLCPGMGGGKGRWQKDPIELYRNSIAEKYTVDMYLYLIWLDPIPVVLDCCNKGSV